MKYSDDVEDLLVTMEETEDPGKGYSYENRVWSVIEVFNLILGTILSPNVASVIRTVVEVEDLGNDCENLYDEEYGRGVIV